MIIRRARLVGAWLRPRRPIADVGLTAAHERPSSTLLPFTVDIPVRSYLDYAFPLSIVAPDAHHRARLLESFIQLFFPDDKLPYDRVLMMPALRTPDWERLGLIGTETIETHSRRLRRPEALLDLLTRHLADGRYVEIHLDEFFLPRRPCHGRMHSVHDNMLIGYDLTARTFQLAGYSTDYEQYPVSWDDVLRAFYHMPRGQLGRRMIRTIWRREGRSQRFDLRGMAAQLADYVASRQTLTPREMRRARLYRKARRFTGAWGLDTYEAFRAYVRRQSAAREPIDLRSTRTLWEHKACMRDRLQYLEDEGLVSADAGHALAYAEVERLARGVRFGAYEYNAAGMGSSHADALSGSLTTMERLERAILRDVVSALPTDR